MKPAFWACQAIAWAIIFAGACSDDISHITDVELPDARVDTVTVVDTVTLVDTLPAPPPDTVTIVIDWRLENGVWCKSDTELHRATRYPWEHKVLWTCKHEK